ncbi:hypothetical protein D3C80_1953540 [compost metagenome]
MLLVLGHFTRGKETGGVLRATWPEFCDDHGGVARWRRRSLEFGIQSLLKAGVEPHPEKNRPTVWFQPAGSSTIQLRYRAGLPGSRNGFPVVG